MVTEAEPHQQGPLPESGVSADRIPLRTRRRVNEHASGGFHRHDLRVFELAPETSIDLGKNQLGDGRLCNDPTFKKVDPDLGIRANARGVLPSFRKKERLEEIVAQRRVRRRAEQFQFCRSFDGPSRLDQPTGEPSRRGQTLLPRDLRRNCRPRQRDAAGLELHGIIGEDRIESNHVAGRNSFEDPSHGRLPCCEIRFVDICGRPKFQNRFKIRDHERWFSPGLPGDSTHFWSRRSREQDFSMTTGPEAFRSTSPDLHIINLQEINDRSRRGILCRQNCEPGDLTVDIGTRQRPTQAGASMVRRI